MIRRIGYARVLPGDKKINQQMFALNEEGCVAVFFDEATGCRTKRQGFEDCLKSINSGDVVVIQSLDRIGCSLSNLVAIVCSLAERNVCLESLDKNGFTMNSISGLYVIEVFKYLARYQINLNDERTLNARLSAKAIGIKGGI